MIRDRCLHSTPHQARAVTRSACSSGSLDRKTHVSRIEGVAMSSIVLLGAHRWGRASAVEHVIASGKTPVLLLFDSEDVPPELSKKLHASQVLRVRSGEAVDDIRKRIHAVAGDDWYAVGLDDYVCELAASLPVPERQCFPPAAARIAQQKHELRRRWNAHCARDLRLHPVEYRTIEFDDLSLRSVTSDERSAGFSQSCRAIIKPDALDASLAVYALESFDQDYERARCMISDELLALKAYTDKLNIEIHPRLQIEHEIPRGRTHPGAEFSLEILSTMSAAGSSRHELLGITEKYITSNFVEVAHVFPSKAFPEHLMESAFQACASLLDEIGVRYCLSHWEMIVTPDERLALVEAQLRPPGDRITELIESVAGEHPYATLFAHVGSARPRSAPTNKRDVCAAVFFLGPTAEISKPISITIPLELISSPRLLIDDDLKTICGWHGPISTFTRPLSLTVVDVDFHSAKAQASSLASRIFISHRDPRGATSSVPLQVWTLE
jgi:hypothetical protein